MRILAADDDDGLMRALGRWLRTWGYEIVTARDGLEAWRILKRDDAPRLAILDWDMPGLPGLEVCRLLRSAPHGSDVYVLMLTARNDKNDLVAALESGADDFLSKPFHPRELQLRLAKAVRDAHRSRPLSATSDTLPPKSDGARAARGKAQPPPTGTVLGGKYRLEAELARGGMGSVWRGIHLSLGINVAIKFMDAALAETADYSSFEREARAAAQLRNEHALRVYDHGMTEEGLPYLVMEYLAGESLWARVERAGALELEAAAMVVSQAASALAEAHARGIVHRDVKPENILLVDDPDPDRGPVVKLIDFGLASVPRSNGEGRAPNAGTPAYMSPECLAGTSPATAALDLWGLAATAFFALSGEVAFDGATLDDIFQRVCTAPLPVPSATDLRVPLQVDAWFARACSRDPEKRFATAKALAEALESAVGLPVDTSRHRPSSRRERVGFLKTEPESAPGLEATPDARTDRTAPIR